QMVNKNCNDHSNHAKADQPREVRVPITAATRSTHGGTLIALADALPISFSGVTLTGLTTQSYTLNFTATGLSAVESEDVTLTGASATTHLWTTTKPTAGMPAAALTKKPVIENRDAQRNVISTDNTTELRV